MELSIANALIGYGIGALVWAVILGATDSELTPGRMVGVILWPLPMAHWVGLILRNILP